MTAIRAIWIIVVDPNRRFWIILIPDKLDLMIVAYVDAFAHAIPPAVLMCYPQTPSR